MSEVLRDALARTIDPEAFDDAFWETRSLGMVTEPEPLRRARFEQDARKTVAYRTADAVLASPLIQAVAHEAWDEGWDRRDRNSYHDDSEGDTENPYPLTGPNPLNVEAERRARAYHDAECVFLAPARAEAAADALDAFANDALGISHATLAGLALRAAEYRAGTR